MSDAAVAKGAKWYEPTGWPRWVRWAAVAPLSLLAAIAIYFIYAIINGIASELPSSITSLFAIAIGVYVYVGVGRVIAPAFSKLVGFTLATTALTFIGWFLGNVVANAPHGIPQWYAVLVGLAAMGAALGGAFADIPDRVPHEREVYAWLPGALRWVLFIPIAVTLAVAVCFVLAVPLALMSLNSDVVRLINTPLATATFIAVCAAVVPKAKNVVGIIFAVLLGLLALVQLFSGIDRGAAVQIFASLAHKGRDEIAWSMTPWYQTLTGLGMLAGCCIGMVGSVQAEKTRKATEAASQ